jgi:hypothetical protein
MSTDTTGDDADPIRAAIGNAPPPTAPHDDEGEDFFAWLTPELREQEED